MLTQLTDLKAEFSSLPDGFARYCYLVELSALLPEGSAALRQPEHRYEGCQSLVWLRVWREDGLCRLEADSDTLILRGILYLYRLLYDGETAARSAALAPLDLLRELDLGEHFGARRALGIGGLAQEIQKRLVII